MSVSRKAFPPTPPLTINIILLRLTTTQHTTTRKAQTLSQQGWVQ